MAQSALHLEQLRSLAVLRQSVVWRFWSHHQSVAHVAAEIYVPRVVDALLQLVDVGLDLPGLFAAVYHLDTWVVSVCREGVLQIHLVLVAA